MHLYLIGFMGAGKSTIGPILSELMGRPFVDLDRQIERLVGARIQEIFDEEGEPTFRGLETSALRGLPDSPPAVVAVGGGAMSVAENRQHLLLHGRTVWLDVPFEVLCERLAESDRKARPLLGDASSLKKLYDERLADYRRSDFRVAVSSEDNAPGVARAIHELLKERE